MAMTLNIMRKFAVVGTIGCALWSLSFILFGATSNGKTWYTKLSAKHFSDAKGGVPIVALAIPVLVAGSLAALLNVRPDPSATQTTTTVALIYRSSVYRRMQRWKEGNGDFNFNRFAFRFIFIPLCIYLICNIHRHFYGNELSYDAKLTEASNAFAFVALISMSYFLIPVARQSPVLELVELGSSFGRSTAHMVGTHHYCWRNGSRQYAHVSMGFCIRRECCWLIVSASPLLDASGDRLCAFMC